MAPVWPGHHQALGASWAPEATNFAVWSPEAHSVWVCLFDESGRETQHQLTEHTLGVWHGQIPGVPVGQLYGFRADGPWDPSRGQRFNRKKLLLDRVLMRLVGIHHGQMRIVVVKSSNHFRADFQPHASHVLVAKAAGPMAADPADLPWTKLPASTRRKP